MSKASHENKDSAGQQSPNVPHKGVAKGGLEVGREDAGGATEGTRRTADGAAPPPPQISGEKAVRQTKTTVGVDPLDTDARDGDLLPDPALDRRRELVGTDEPKDQTDPRPPGKK